MGWASCTPAAYARRPLAASPGTTPVDDVMTSGQEPRDMLWSGSIWPVQACLRGTPRKTIIDSGKRVRNVRPRPTRKPKCLPLGGIFTSLKLNGKTGVNSNRDSLLRIQMGLSWASASNAGRIQVMADSIPGLRPSILMIFSPTGTDFGFVVVDKEIIHSLSQQGLYG